MRIKWAWYNLLVREPFKWLFIALFQPHRYRRESRNLERRQRITQMFQLALPLFLCILLMVLLFELLFIAIDANIFGFPILQALFRKGLPLLGETTEGIALGIAIGIVIGIKTENINGIAASLIWGTAFGLLSGMFFPVTDIWNFIYKLLATGAQQNGIGGGLLLGPEAVLSDALRGAFMGLIAGIVARMSVKGGAGELARGMLWGFMTGFIVSWLTPGVLALIQRIPKYLAPSCLTPGILAPSCLTPGILAPSLPGLVIITFVMGCAGCYSDVPSRIFHISSYKARGIVGMIAGGIIGIAWWIDVSVRGGNILHPFIDPFIEIAIGIIFGSAMNFLLSAIFTPSTLDHKSLFYSKVGNGLFFFLLIYYSCYSYPYFDYSQYAAVYVRSNLANSYFSYYVPIFCVTLFLMGVVIGVLKPHNRLSSMLVILSSLFFFSIFYGPPFNLLLALWPLATFILGYLCGYFRLPFYPISSISMLRTAYNSKKDHTSALFWLHHSSLYWDERVFFPLPGLERVLHIAMQRDKDSTLQEITFIAEQRLQQLPQIGTAIVEAMLSDLESRDTLPDIAQFHWQFNTFILRQILALGPEWITPFFHLRDASKAVELYYNSAIVQIQQKEIYNAFKYIDKLQPKTAFTNSGFNQRLQKIIATWQERVLIQIEKIEREPQKSSKIESPYKTGNPLELRDTIFKGRKDLAYQLTVALNTDNYHPTFLLHGERRMGKSSVINHLPNLLSSRYIPIYYNTQGPGNLASITTFFTRLADVIIKKMQSYGIRAEGLDSAALDRALLTNEAAVYHVSTNWFEYIAGLLNQEERILLIAFDEFEKLEEASRRQQLDLPLLLDWFRTLIQDYARIVLLFSGVATFKEMGSDWVNRFVNVESLKVTFLNTKEALELITEPVQGFPKRIFDSEVTEKILHVTHGHPFFVQAVCANIILHLNLEGRQQAIYQDVAIAVNDVLEGWDNHFRDLWNRTSEKQRTCLIALISIKQGDAQAIASCTDYSAEIVQQNLEKLIERDLVVHDEQGVYQISVPIFSLWVKRFGLTAGK